MILRTFAAVGAVALVLVTSSTALGQDDRARARQEFGAGVEAFEAGNFERALASFQEAYRLAPHPTVRVNMANCYEQLDKPVEALFHFERFLAEADDADPAQRREVEAAVERLRGEIGEVTFQIAPDGALVRIDQTEVRRAPIREPIRMAPGNHLLEVRADGYQSIRREFIVEAGQPANVGVRLERGDDTAEPEVVPATESGGALTASGAAAASTQAPPPQPEPEPMPLEDDGGGGFHVETPTIIAAGATGAFLVAGVVTGILALGANSDFDDAVRRSNDPMLSSMERAQAREDGLSAKDRANTLSVMTDIFLITAAVGAAATVTLFLLQDGGEEEASAEGIDVDATAVALPEGGAVVVNGRF